MCVAVSGELELKKKLEWLKKQSVLHIKVQRVRIDAKPGVLINTKQGLQSRSAREQKQKELKSKQQANIQTLPTAGARRLLC